MRLYDLCTNHLLGEALARIKTESPDTNYFILMWRRLKASDEIDKLERDSQKKLDSLQHQLSLVPKNINETAYVSLYIEDTNHTRVEMIRFGGVKTQ